MRLFGLLLVSSGLLVSCSPRPTDDLSWLEGCWQSNGQTVECWTRSGPDTFSGESRTTRSDGAQFQETLSIQKDGDRWIYIAQPGNAAPTRFSEVSRNEFEIVFENPEHDYPQKITYQSNGKYTLWATISRLDGSKARKWTFQSVLLLQDEE